MSGLAMNPFGGGQHDAQILKSGNLLLFANGYKTKGPALPFSQIVEMDLTTGQDVWTYVGDPPWSSNSPHISGVQRLSSGNTLICEGLWGRIFEVTPDGRIVWEYVSPYEGWISPGRWHGQLGISGLALRRRLSSYCGSLAVVTGARAAELFAVTKPIV